MRGEGRGEAAVQVGAEHCSLKGEGVLGSWCSSGGRASGRPWPRQASLPCRRWVLLQWGLQFFAMQAVVLLQWGLLQWGLLQWVWWVLRVQRNAGWARGLGRRRVMRCLPWSTTLCPSTHACG